MYKKSPSKLIEGLSLSFCHVLKKVLTVYLITDNFPLAEISLAAANSQ
jgi:hypothetical protein